MKSRISFFDKTVIRKDITRFLPLWLIYFVCGSLVMLMLTIENRPETLARGLGTCIGIFGWINMIYALLAAQLLFGDLYNSRLCNALHAMPLRRETWFFSHAASGILMSLVPNAVGILVTLPVLGKYWYAAFFWLLGMEMHYLFFFGVAVFCVLCTGSRFAGVAVYGILNFFVLIVQWLLDTIYLPMLYGVVSDMELLAVFCPVINLLNFNDDYLIFEWVGDGVSSVATLRFLRLGDPFIYLAIIMVVGIAFGAVALVMYRRRRLESAGDFMAVEFLKPVFAVVFTLCVSAVFAVLGEVMDAFLAFLVVGLLLGWFTAQMLLQRTVKVLHKKTLRGLLALALAMVLSLGMTKLDAFGIANWVPRPEQVERVVISSYGEYITVTDDSPGRLEQVLDIHSKVYAQGKADASQNFMRIELTYQLKDGRTVTRNYRPAVYGAYWEQMKALLNHPESVFGYTDWDSFRDSIVTAYVSYQEEFDYLGKERTQQILDAVLADCAAGNMAQTHWFHSDRFSQEATLTLMLREQDGGTHNLEIFLYGDAANCMQWIREVFGK